MPIPVQSIEERLSVSYVTAVVSRAGFSFELIPQDYGVDLSIRRVSKFKGTLMDIGVALDCQLKATVNWDSSASSIIYDMQADAYNKLVFRRQNSSIPCILILYCLPRDDTQWLTIDENQMNLRKCCYWIQLDSEYTKNSSTIRITIPKDNRFCPDTILRVVDDAVNGRII